MPNIAEIKEIFNATPIDQAIMLEGIHGIGKSEIIKEIFEKQGYAVVVLFLGQMADAGDLVGLPDRTVVEFNYMGKTIQQKITEFCPPKWWPRNSDAKVVVFLDEFNRGKPEVYQCIQDMTLNRKLNGLELPSCTRIIAAINPHGEEYDYDVVDLDPALLDRFNKYVFNPDPEEWMDWAMEHKVNKYIIGFISKNKQELDPPLAASRKSGKKYPSRRSWKRVSDVINKNEDIIHGDMILFRNLVSGIVGEGATSKLTHYIKESSRGVSGGKIVTNWDHDTSVAIKNLNNQELIHVNGEISVYLETSEVVLFDSGRKEAMKYAKNVEYYLKCVPKEIAANFMDYVTQAEQKGKKWGDKLLSNNPNLVNWFVDVIHGETEEDKALKRSLNPDGERNDDGFGDVSSEIDDMLK
jgi:hypothetical protein